LRLPVVRQPGITLDFADRPMNLTLPDCGNDRAGRRHL
jgi:hypothetical protein